MVFLSALGSVRFASKKAGSGARWQSSGNRKKKYRGLKHKDGEFVQAGTMLATQLTLRFFPGLNVIHLVSMWYWFLRRLHLYSTGLLLTLHLSLWFRLVLVKMELFLPLNLERLSFQRKEYSQTGSTPTTSDFFQEFLMMFPSIRSIWMLSLSPSIIGLDL